MEKCNDFLEKLKENPDDFETLFNIGKCYSEEDVFKSHNAIPHLLKALEIGKKEKRTPSELAIVNYQLAIVYKNINRKDLGVPFVDEAISLDSSIENKFYMGSKTTY